MIDCWNDTEHAGVERRRTRTREMPGTMVTACASPRCVGEATTTTTTTRTAAYGRGRGTTRGLASSTTRLGRVGTLARRRVQPHSGRRSGENHTKAVVNDADIVDAEDGWSHITADYLWKSELAGRVTYLDDFEREELRDALEMAFNAHDGQKRKSGEPFITHPVAVAAILAEMELDHESLIAGLLHDTVEDTKAVTFDSLEKRFGKAVRRIVEGETKVSKVSSSLSKQGTAAAAATAEDVKSEDLAQMFLAMTEEVRIIIVKLADRLHNMRTLEGLKPEKRVKIAKETLLVFAPLAKLLGMYKVKNELEDLAFRYAEPQKYADMARRCDELSKVQEPVIQKAALSLQQALQGDEFLRGNTVGVTIQAKAKEFYGLHRKCAAARAKNGAFTKNGSAKNPDEIFEVAQLRIILHDTGAMAGLSAEARRLQASRVCYHVLGIVHAMWPPVPGNMKDYIATPKLNGYKALHTVVLPITASEEPNELPSSAGVFPMEIMIRTEAMHVLAENGIAADVDIRQSWRTAARRTTRQMRAERRAILIRSFEQKGLPIDKEAIAREEAIDRLAEEADQGMADGGDKASLRQVAWLNNIQTWQKEFIDVLSAREFVDTITSDLLGRRVFVFTPKGEVTNLPYGATVVDYAFYTDVGLNMKYAKVNGVEVSQDHVLKNAEVVEICTDIEAAPAHLTIRRLRWMRLAASTRSARAKIQKQLARLGGGDIKELRESLQIEALTLAGAPIPDTLGPGVRTVSYCASAFELVAKDRAGLLAMVSAAISNAGANIDSYTGVKVAHDCFKMNFAIHFDDSELREGASLKSMDANLSKLYTEITRLPGVDSGAMYCDIDAAKNAL